MFEDIFDIAIIGGGINGCGIARDAAGRGLKVYLCEKGDLASGTSSASTKLSSGMRPTSSPGERPRIARDDSEARRMRPSRS